MKQAYINLVQEQFMHNCLLRPIYDEQVQEYFCTANGCQFKAEFVKNRYQVTSEHTCFQIATPSLTHLMQEGDCIILSFSFDEIFEIALKPGQEFQNRYGVYPHSSFINQPYGAKIYNKQNSGFVIPLEFQPSLHTEALKRCTQILFTPDISCIVNRACLRPGCVVVEAGIGSGSLSHAFIQRIYPGKLYNFDIFQDRVDQAQRAFDRYARGCATSRLGSVFEVGFQDVPDHVSDLVFLDLPTPELCLKEVCRVAKPCSHFIVFLPCTEQVHQLLCEAYKYGIHSAEVVKVQTSAYEYDNRTLSAVQAFDGGKGIRDLKKIQQFRKVAVARTHTGYLVCARVGEGK